MYQDKLLVHVLWQQVARCVCNVIGCRLWNTIDNLARDDAGIVLLQQLWIFLISDIIAHTARADLGRGLLNLDSNDFCGLEINLVGESGVVPTICVSERLVGDGFQCSIFFLRSADKATVTKDDGGLIVHRVMERRHGDDEGIYLGDLGLRCEDCQVNQTSE